MKYFYKDTYTGNPKKEISRNDTLTMLIAEYNNVENTLKIAEKKRK